MTTNEKQVEVNEKTAGQNLEQQAVDAVEPQEGTYDPAGESAGDELSQLKQQLEEANALSEENYQRSLRAQADFDNFRRRARLEKEEFLKYASSKLVEQLLPVMDNLDRALSSSKETKDFDALVKGLDMTFRQLDQILAEEGLQEMNAIGQPFNPDLHQAIMKVESEEHEEGIVVEEVQKGYRLKDKVLRPAMVKVSM